MEDVKMWLSSQVADFFDTGIQKLRPHVTSASIPTVTMLRSSLCVNVFLYIILSFLVACFVNSSPEVTFQKALIYSYIHDKLIKWLLID
jgi:hypothetical protein